MNRRILFALVPCLVICTLLVTTGKMQKPDTRHENTPQVTGGRHVATTGDLAPLRVVRGSEAIAAGASGVHSVGTNFQKQPHTGTPPAIDPARLPAHLRRHPKAPEGLNTTAVRKAIQVRNADVIKEKEGTFGYNNGSFGASFLQEGILFGPSAVTPSPDHPNLAYAFEQMSLGDVRVATGGASAPQLHSEERTIVYDRGGVEERYTITSAGVEQSFIVRTLPAARGDLVVDCRVTTGLTPTCTGDSVVFSRNGTPAIQITQALVIDAAGRELALSFMLDGDHVLMTIPAAWMQNASLPITIDPLLGSVITVDGSETDSYIYPLDVAFNTNGASLNYLVVWNEQFGASAFDFDVLGQLVTGAGALTGGQILIAFTGWGEYQPAVSYAPTVNEYLVVWENDPSTAADDKHIRCRRVAANGSMPAVSFGFNLALDDLYPDVAFDGTNWGVVWTNVFDAAFFDYDVLYVQVTTGQVVGPAGVYLDGAADLAIGPSTAFLSGKFLTAFEKWDFINPITVSGNTNSPNTAADSGTPITISQNANDNGYPDVAAGGTQFLITYNSSVGATDNDIVGRVATTTLTFPGSEFTVAGGTSDQWPCRSGWSSSNSEWLVVYTDTITNAGDMYGMRVTAAGAVTGTAQQISSLAALDQFCAIAVNNSANQALVVWQTGSASPWSVVAQRMSLDFLPPTVPVLSTPANGACYAPASTVALDWADSTDLPSPGGTGVQNYDVEVASDAGFVTIVASATVVASTYTTPALGAGTYYWHVRARDNVNNVSAYSTANNFIVDGVAPSVPVLSTPLTGACVGATPTLDWADSTDAGCGIQNYDVQIDNDPLFGSVDVAATVVPSTYTTPALATGTWYWRVRARDTVGNVSAFSGSFSMIVDVTAPSVPTLSTPANGTCLPTTSATLDWTDSVDVGCGMQNYDIQVDDDPAFGTPIVNTTVVASTYATGALTTGTWYWRVRARDLANNVSSYTGNGNFLIDATAPGIPTLSTPANGACLTTPAVVLDWSDVSDTGCSGLSKYSIEVDNDPAFTSLNYANTTVASTDTTTALASGTYYWRVQAIDFNGNASAFSTVFTFSVDQAAPSVPTLTAPTNASCVNTTTPTLAWSASTDVGCGVQDYDVQVATDAAFLSVVYSTTTAATSTVTSALTDGVLYYWHVRARDLAGNLSAYSGAFTFTVDTTAPTVPTLVSPANAACLAASPTLDWTDSTDVGCGLLNYDVQIDDDPAFGSPIVNTTVIPSTYAASGLTTGTWYWRVRSRDVAGNTSSFTANGNFSVDATAPTVPTLLTPANGSCLTSSSVTLDWTDSTDTGCAGMGQYHLQVDDDPAFGSPLVDVNVALSTYNIASIASGTYYWRVQALDTLSNTSAYTASFSFSIDQANPSVPTLLTPADGGCVPNGTPTLDWADATDVGCGILNYDIQIATDAGFLSIVQSATVVPSQYTVSPALATSTYFWRVRSRDIPGNVSAYSTAFSFMIDVTPPTLPTLTSPANGVCMTTPVVLDWTDSTDVGCGLLNYDIQIDDDPAFGSPAVNTTTLTSTYSPVGLTTGTWYWRVQSRDTAGNVSGFTVNGNFLLDVTAPTVPTLVTPANAACLTTAAVVLDWTDSVDTGCSGLQDYHVQVDDDPAFATPAVDLDVVASTYTTPALASGTYYWRVRSRDALGNSSAYTASFSFSVDLSAPSLPTLLTPVNGASVVTSIVTLDWTDAVDAGCGILNYDVQVDDDPLFGSPVVNATVVPSTYTTPALPDGTYYWRVLARDVPGNTSGFTASFVFTIDVNDPPNAPTSLNQYKLDGTTTIALGAATNETGVVFKGTVSDIEGNSCQLQVEVKVAGVAFDGITGLTTGAAVASGSTASVTVSGLVNGTSYHWRARTIDVLGLPSLAWTAFGGNPEPAGVDFSINTGGASTPPADPTALNQYMADAVTVIPTGATTNETQVVFKAGVSDPDGNSCQLEVEVKSISTAFNGAGTVLGAFFASGTTAQVTVTGLVPGTSYHWRVRAGDSTGAVSGWVAFGGNNDTPPAAVDFAISVVPNSPPAAPSGLAQFRLDGVTGIGLGATTNETGVVFSAAMTDPDGNSVALQVEVKPVGSGFSGVVSGTGSFVASGGTGTVTINGLLTGTSYHWQARTLDANGATSAWVSFGGNGDIPVAGTDFAVDTSSNSAPSASGPGQFRSDGTTAIAAAGTTNESVVVFKATVSDPDGDPTRLQVEVLVGAFTGVPTAESVPVAGGTATVTVAGLVPGIYHWRYRAIDSNNNASAWTDFPPGDPDFTVVVNNPPAAPAGLGQFRIDGVTAIAVGGTTAQGSVIMRGTITDPDGDQVRLQIEVRPAATPFSNVATQTSGLVGSGSTVDVTFPIPGVGGYHWQARTVDASGAGSAPWTLFNAAGTHFTRIPNSAPTTTGAGQFDGAGGPVLPVGGAQTANEVEFRAPVLDADGDPVRLEIEVLPVGVGFSNVANFQSAFVASGGTAVIDVSGGLTPNTNHHWQYRVVDDQGNAGAWASFGGNLDPGDTDFFWRGPGTGGFGGSRGHASCFSSAGALIVAPWWLVIAALVMALRRRK